MDTEAREFVSNYPPAAEFEPFLVYGSSYRRAVVDNLRSAQNSARIAEISPRADEFRKIEAEYLAFARKHATA